MNENSKRLIFLTIPTPNETGTMTDTMTFLDDKTGNVLTSRGRDILG